MRTIVELHSIPFEGIQKVLRDAVRDPRLFFAQGLYKVYYNPDTIDLHSWQVLPYIENMMYPGKGTPLVMPPPQFARQFFVVFFDLTVSLWPDVQLPDGTWPDPDKPPDPFQGHWQLYGY